MSSIQPEGEALRRAVRFVSEGLQDDPAADVMGLVDQACLRFDLKPNQAEYLTRFYAQARKAQE